MPIQLLLRFYIRVHQLTVYSEYARRVRWRLLPWIW
jgi:hypothetical protein